MVSVANCGCGGSGSNPAGANAFFEGIDQYIIELNLNFKLNSRGPIYFFFALTPMTVACEYQRMSPSLSADSISIMGWNVSIDSRSIDWHFLAALSRF